MELLTGRIYIIRSPNTEMVYVGGTIQSLKRRFNRHCYDLENPNERRTSSHLILEKGEAYIELLQEVLVETKRDLEKFEQEWIDKTPNTVNMKRAYMTEEEAKRIHVERNTRYAQEHKEQVAEFHRKYYQANKEKMAETTRKYREEHKEKVIEQMKIWRERHREKQNERRREKILCEICDCYVCRGNIRTHERTKKHIANLEMSS